MSISATAVPPSIICCCVTYDCAQVRHARPLRSSHARKSGEPDPGRRHPGRRAAVPADAPVEAAGCRRGRRPRTGGQRDPVPGVWAGPGRRRPGSFVARPGRAGAGSVHTPSAAVASSPSVVGPVCTPAATHHGPSVLAPVRAARAQPSCRHLHPRGHYLLKPGTPHRNERSPGGVAHQQRQRM